MQNASLRYNITFGCPYEEKAYEKVNINLMSTLTASYSSKLVFLHKYVCTDILSTDILSIFPFGI
jgi:hypothetical protein